MNFIEPGPIKMRKEEENIFSVYLWFMHLSATFYTALNLIYCRNHIKNEENFPSSVFFSKEGKTLFSTLILAGKIGLNDFLFFFAISFPFQNDFLLAAILQFFSLFSLAFDVEI